MRVIIAGGGTGGHLFPGIAIAQGFLDRYPETRILFVGTEKGIEKRVIPEMGFELKTISSAGIRGVSMLKKALAIMKIPVAFVQSIMIIRSFRPHLVIGVGGYASGPLVLCASLMGVRSAIHEQNAEAGVTNRILSRFVDRIFTSHERTLDQFPEKKSVYAGNPVRKELIRRFRPEGNGLSEDGELPSLPDGERGGRFCVLLFGGSQGARKINRSFVDSLKYLSSIKDRLEFIVQTGPYDLDWVRRAVENSGFHVEIHSFIDDMSCAYGRADLVVSRAGASTIAELALCGKPAILVPYPYAIGDHQRHNAEAMETKGAALMVQDRDLTGEVLARAIMGFFQDRKALHEMGRNAWRLGRPEATELIVKECMKLIGNIGER